MITAIAEKEQQFRRDIANFEYQLSKLPNAKIGHEMDETLCPLKHTFIKGSYRREIFMPKGLSITSKIHKFEHFYFILKGKCLVRTENGVEELVAPYQGVTPAGTKRGIQVLEDTIWVTIHVTDETDLYKIEEQIIAKSFDDPALSYDKQKKIEEANCV